MSASVTCPSCSKKYALKPELAGKRAKCKCGGQLQFPAMAGALADGPGAVPVIPLEAKDDKPQKARSSVFEPLDASTGSYDLSEDVKPAKPAATAPATVGSAACSSCKKPLPPGAVICMACGTNQKTGATSRTQVFNAPAPVQKASPQRAASRGSSRSGMGNILVGIVLILIGGGITIGTYTAAAHGGGGSYTVMYGAIIVGIWRVIRGLAQMASGE